MCGNYYNDWQRNSQVNKTVLNIFVYSNILHMYYLF